MRAFAGAATLIERQEAKDAVNGLLGRACPGQTTTLFIIAQAGLGKTALLDYACATAMERGFAVGLGRAHSMESSLPFGLFTQALDRLGGCHLLEDVAIDAPTGEIRATQFYRVKRWLESLGSGPVLLALDDLHWADQDSLALFSFLCRRVAPTSLSFVATLRPWPAEAHHLALGLAHDRYAGVEQLAPLSEKGAVTLLEGEVNRPLPDDAARRALGVCGGNPLLLRQLVQAMNDDEKAILTPDSLSRASKDLLLSRFASLSRDAIRCAQAAAVLETEALQEIVAEVAELDESEVDSALESLARSGTISEVSDRLEFVHSLFRQALYSDLARPVRMRLHARAFAALVRRGMEGPAAEHAVRARLVGNTEAVAVLERVGRTARQMGALATAAERFGAAATLAADRAGPELLLAFGEATLAGATPAHSIGVLERVVAQPEALPRLRVEALAMLGRAMALTGADSRAAARFEEAVDLASSEDAAMALPVLLQYAVASWLTAGPVRALPLARQARELARRADDKTRTAAESTWAFMALQSGDGTAIEALVPSTEGLDVDALAQEITGGGGQFDWLTNLALAMTLTERVEDADRLVHALQGVADRLGSPQFMATLANARSYICFLLGRLPEALEFNERARSLGELVPMIEPIAAISRAGILLYMGDQAESQQLCEHAEATATRREQWIALLFLWDLLGHRYLREGKPAEACEFYARLESTLTRMGIGEPCLPPWACHGISAYMSAGRVEDAMRVVHWLEERAASLPCRFPRIAAATGRALLAEQRGEPEEAQAFFDVALRLHGEVIRPLDKVETLLSFGAFLRRAGQRAQARPLLVEALELAKTCGSGWLTGLVRDELRVAGGRRRRRTEEPDDLTAQEQRIADIAATGATNPEIARQLHLSVSTVRTHLEHVYARLGIDSRRDLIAMAQPLRTSKTEETSPGGV